MKKLLILTTILLCITNLASAEELLKQQSKYPDYGYMYLGSDKYEKMNRKVFSMNAKVNKYAIRPVHILWASIMPEYGMDRIHYAYKNIEYPKRLVSSLIQKDFKTSGTETVRFLTNTTIGLGGMFDPAKTLFKIEPTTEDMEQALSKCKCNCGSYVVLPIISGTTTRGIAGKILDVGLNPTTYVATPVLAMVKAGLTVNRTSYMQPLMKMVESTYADPYEITRKMYGLDNFIKCHNLDRKHVLKEEIPTPDYNDLPPEINPELVKLPNRQANTTPSELKISEFIQNDNKIEDTMLRDYNLEPPKIRADKALLNYNPQCPVVDSMRTALFNLPEIKKSVWHELSIWNRCFCKKIKTSTVNITPEKQDYKFRYIMQKDKNSPLAIIYPSIGEGINSSHSDVFAKIFYDKGYSVVIQGSHFQWEFVKSTPDDYKPGIPTQDAQQLRLVTGKIINKLEDKYNCKFEKKVLIGTSFGAMTALFVADIENRENTLGIKKYISICPPIELLYAMEQVDQNGEDWKNNTENLKEQVAKTASKIVLLNNEKNNKDFEINTLPFSEEEGKLITGFVMHQKLSDLIFTLENTPKNKPTDIYQTINNMNYKDYTQKYLLGENYENFDAIRKDTSLLSLSDYLTENNNYKIFHSVDDYLVNNEQLKLLKLCTGKNTTLLSNGGHLGFMYTPEFIEMLKEEIK